MYLSRLKLDPCSRITRDLRLNPYLLHQAVFRAFPDSDDGGPGRVLYRMDIDREGKTSLLVQSEKEPKWEKAEKLIECIEETVQTREKYDQLLRERIKKGRCLYFRLRANPTVKKQTEGKKNGHRLGLLREEDQIEWLSRKAEDSGFAVVRCQVMPEGVICDNRGAGKLSHYAVQFEGTLKVVDPQLFLRTVAQGVGSAKGFGFGLLSVAPLRET